MAAKVPRNSSSVSKSVERSHQSQVTHFFKPSSGTHSPARKEIQKSSFEPKENDKMTSSVSPAKKTRSLVNEIIEVNEDSSDIDLEENLYSPPPKKSRTAKIAKRPLTLATNISKNSNDNVTEKRGLGSLSNEVYTTSACTTKGKNTAKLEKRPSSDSNVTDYQKLKMDISCSPEGKKFKYNKIFSNHEKDRKSVQRSPLKLNHKRSHNVSNVSSYSTRSKVEKKETENFGRKKRPSSDLFDVELDLVALQSPAGKKFKRIIPFSSPDDELTHKSPSKWIPKKNLFHSSRDVLNDKNKADRIEVKESPSKIADRIEAKSRKSHLDDDHKRSDRFSSKVGLPVTPKKSVKSDENVKKSAQKGDSVVAKDSNKSASDKGKTSKTAASKGTRETKSKSNPRVVRRSTTSLTEKNGISISSKIIVGMDEISAGAAFAFKQTYKNTETLLDMNLDVKVCHDLQWATKNTKNVLANRFHVNFTFFMDRGFHASAIGSFLRIVNRSQYPRAEDLHTIVHKILMNGSDHLLLQRAQELIYKILGLHPSSDAHMRKYYWSVMSPFFDDSEPFSRWENLRNLLSEVLNADEEDALTMHADPTKPASMLERKRIVLAFFVHLLREDLRCWIQLVDQPSVQIRERTDLPLIARLIWSQSTIPHTNSICRELISFHATALKSGNSLNLSFTEPFMKMMAIVTQLSDLQLPLKIRKCSIHMVNLAREIVHHSEDLVNTSYSFYYSFGSPELCLLLPLIVLSRYKPEISFSIDQLNLAWLTKSYLVDGEEAKIVADFRSQTTVVKNAFLMAVTTYLKLYCAWKIWFHMRDKYRNSIRASVPLRQNTSQPLPDNMFSRTFTEDLLMDDLRETKFLLEIKSGEKQRSLLSTLSY